jgi:hypothetical protein
METEQLGKLEVEEEKLITILAAISGACEGGEIPMPVYMTLGLLYGYTPDEFFIRLANTTVKMAEKIGHGDEPIVDSLRIELKNIDDNTAKANDPGNLNDLL